MEGTSDAWHLSLGSRDWQAQLRWPLQVWPLQDADRCFNLLLKNGFGTALPPTSAPVQSSPRQVPRLPACPLQPGRIYGGQATQTFKSSWDERKGSACLLAPETWGQAANSASDHSGVISILSRGSQRSHQSLSW